MCVLKKPLHLHGYILLFTTEQPYFFQGSEKNKRRLLLLHSSLPFFVCPRKKVQMPSKDEQCSLLLLRLTFVFFEGCCLCPSLYFSPFLGLEQEQAILTHHGNQHPAAKPTGMYLLLLCGSSRVVKSFWL